MKLTDALRGEHGVFYPQFDYIEQSVPAVEDLAVLKTQATMLASALATHAKLEEELLFQAMDSDAGAVGPLTVMRAEHEQVEGGLSEIPNVTDLAEAQQRLLHVVEIARQHFAKEEQILFMLAEQSLDNQTLNDLGAQWAMRREVMI